MVLRSDDSNYQNQIISKHYTDRKDKSMEQNLRLKAAIIEVVETQLDLNDPPEIQQTLDRLVSEGYAIDVAKELIGNVVVAEVFEVIKEGKPFELKRYVAALDLLPGFQE